MTTTYHDLLCKSHEMMAALLRRYGFEGSFESATERYFGELVAMALTSNQAPGFTTILRYCWSDFGIKRALGIDVSQGPGSVQCTVEEVIPGALSLLVNESGLYPSELITASGDMLTGPKNLLQLLVPSSDGMANTVCPLVYEARKLGRVPDSPVAGCRYPLLRIKPAY